MTNGTIPTIDELRATSRLMTQAYEAAAEDAREQGNQAELLRLGSRIATAYAGMRQHIADLVTETTDPITADRLRELLVEEM